MSKYHQHPIGYVSKVSLRVLDLNKSVAFYKNILKMSILNQNETQADLSVNGKDVLLTLYQLNNGSKKPPRTTGLYHFALLLPNRKELGKILNHFIQHQIPLQGASDHGISEAIYLSDPEGNGIEIAADTQPETWKWKHGQLDVFADNGPMDVKAVLNASQNERFEKLPSDTIIGHIHLHGSELKNIRTFYEKGLGMDVVIDLPRQALFFSYGKYHHHLAVNVWNGIAALTPPSSSAGLMNFELRLPNDLSLHDIESNLKVMDIQYSIFEKGIAVSDPSGNNIIIYS
ncbi:MAG: VOC family protein [Erysipelothrix sp.]|nr:VOC family protein [Erysipelothrix sp.]